MELTAETPADSGPPFQPVATGYRTLLRLRLVITWLVLWIAAAIVDRVLLAEQPWFGLPTIGIGFLAVGSVLFAPTRIYQRLRYRLTGQLLQVMRGWLFHVDTIVPFVRVQHIDVTRGPLDKLCGTATLVVHTAGTHNSIVTVPGLEPDRATEIRDVIREHVRTDFA